MGSIHWVKESKDRFIVATENILKLFEIQNDNHKLLISETRFKDILPRTIISSTSNDLEKKEMVAFGYSSSKCVVLNLNKLDNVIEMSDTRQVTCVDFKSTDNKLIVGYEKTRDHCISLWDFNRTSPYIVSNICSGDGVTSICWDTDYKLIIAGLSSKHIKIYDSRQLENRSFTITTKHTLNGLKCSPNGYHILSYAENFFAIHDLRNFDKAMIQVNTAKCISSAQWCPTTYNVVGVVQGDDLLYLYENLNEDSEPYIRTCYPFGKEAKINIVSFSFKDTLEERALCLSSGSKVSNFAIPLKSTVLLDVKNHEMILDAAKQIKFMSFQNLVETELEDISIIMQKRALKDYGLIADIKENGDLSNDPQLKSVWILLARMYDKGCMLGIKSILGIKETGMMVPKSEVEYIDWCDYPTFAPLKVYKSDQRTKALSLCGWQTSDFNERSSSNNYHDSCRAALAACFELKLKQAVEILSKSTCDSVDQSNVLRITAIVLDNFNPEKYSSSEVLSDINEPFLKAIFAFLNKKYDSVLSGCDLPISDKMIFALKYLSDSSLTEFIIEQINRCIEIGDLNGILLVGASSEGVSLLQSYLDISDDIQTVALIASRFFTSEPFRIQYWIQTYRDILDGWNLFDQRAQLDIMMNSKTTLPKAIQLLCNFCGKSISSGFQEENRTRLLVNKISSCPNCRKTLTRCSLCMLHLGTCSTDFSDRHSRKPTAIFQTKPFSNWFSWCQTCRHGGHMKHLLTWFSQNSVCPVTDCTCCCSSIDKTLISKMLS